MKTAASNLFHFLLISRKTLPINQPKKKSQKFKINYENYRIGIKIVSRQYPSNHRTRQKHIACLILRKAPHRAKPTAYHRNHDDRSRRIHCRACGECEGEIESQFCVSFNQLNFALAGESATITMSARVKSLSSAVWMKLEISTMDAEEFPPIPKMEKSTAHGVSGEDLGKLPLNPFHGLRQPTKRDMSCNPS